MAETTLGRGTKGMKWQLISMEDGDQTLKHYRILKAFGARLFSRPEIGAWEFRFAQFSVGYSPAPLQQSKHGFTIPIPFMRNDWTIILLKRTGKKNERRQ